MELTREALAQVKFRTRGQWYDALQVDQFIEELMAAADRQEEESRLLREEWMARLAQATEEAQGLRERLRALERESRAARTPAQGETQPLEEERDQTMKTIIEREFAAYIVDKAAQMGVECTAQVTCELEENGVFLPQSAVLQGTFSSEQREEMAGVLEEELGIAREQQIIQTKEESP